MPRSFIITLYSAGLRQSECLNPRIRDIHSKRMVLHIFGKDPLRCVACGIGRLRFIAALPPLPPNLVALSSG